MPSDELTVQEVIRYANHDFMNRLQVINMNLDLGHTDAAKALIEQYAESTRMLSELNRLASPQLTVWLQTCKWRYPNLYVQITCSVEEALEAIYDQPLVEYLEKTVLHYYDHLNASVETELSIDVMVTHNTKKLVVCLEGAWNIAPLQLNDDQIMRVLIEEATEECFSYKVTWQ